jgi:hypothetical protein
LHHEYVDVVMGELAPENRRLFLVTTPGAGNDNLQTQKGLFLLYRPYRIDPAEKVDCRPYDEILAEILPPKIPFMFQLTLESVYAPELLRLLAASGMDSSVIDPTLRGVAEAVKMRRFWPQLEGWYKSEEFSRVRSRWRPVTEEMFGNYEARWGGRPGTP